MRNLESLRRSYIRHHTLWTMSAFLCRLRPYGDGEQYFGSSGYSGGRILRAVLR